MLTKGNIFKTWDCQVSYEVEDVSLPNNTIFYFFSAEKANLEICQLNFSDIVSKVWVDNTMQSIALDNKLYCCGKRQGRALIVKTNNYGEIVGENFFDKLANNLDFEFVD